MTRHSSDPACRGTASTGLRHAGHTPRRNAGLAAYENVLARAGFSPIAGIDEAGRGACAGPLVVAAVALDQAAIRRLPGLADSKALTPQARENMYQQVTRRALAWHVVVIEVGEISAAGLHVCNIEGMRRAFAGLRCRPGYVLTDGFPVRGLGSPALAVWKGDQVTASVAAASVLAKVTRDRIMCDLHERFPDYGFAQHKGYCTDEHMEALLAHGPCSEHRLSYANVREAMRRRADGVGAEAKDLLKAEARDAVMAEERDALVAEEQDVLMAEAEDALMAEAGDGAQADERTMETWLSLEAL